MVTTVVAFGGRQACQSLSSDEFVDLVEPSENGDTFGSSPQLGAECSEGLLGVAAGVAPVPELAGGCGQQPPSNPSCSSMATMTSEGSKLGVCRRGGNDKPETSNTSSPMSSLSSAVLSPSAPEIPSTLAWLSPVAVAPAVSQPEPSSSSRPSSSCAMNSGSYTHCWPPVGQGNPQQPMYSTFFTWRSCSRNAGMGTEGISRCRPGSTNLNSPDTWLYSYRWTGSGFKLMVVPALSNCSSIMANGSKAISPCTGTPSVRKRIGIPVGSRQSTVYRVIGTGNMTDSKLAHWDLLKPFKHRNARNTDLIVVSTPMMSRFTQTLKETG
mmetsp:Transcript_96326/g.276567  ORF Transcript_96326/g.276567 Transcript_96326/m.276567 type:complete len:325 (+) Transcript_96326:45-1019(+)